jgi:AcrR family transcriptional regulator
VNAVDGVGRRPRQAEVERNDQALLRAAREVVAEEGPHASVATIAARAGVGVGSLYRRYRTKEELFQRLCTIALTEYLRAAEEGLADDDPWRGLAHYVRSAISFGPGSLAAIAGTIGVTPAMAELSARGDAAVAALVGRAHESGVVRADVNDMDVALLIEQLTSAPVVDQLTKQGRQDLLPAARAAHARLVAIALAGLRAPAAGPLPEPAPTPVLFSERWAVDAAAGRPAAT